MGLIGANDPVRLSVRDLILRLTAISGSAAWNEYAHAWLDDLMAAAVFVDPFTHRPATPLDWVRDSQAGATAVARGGRSAAAYAFARGLEDAAWSVEFLEIGKPEKARAFLLSAARHTGLSVDGVPP